MSQPNRHNPYSFDAFLEKLRGFDFYLDDPFLQRVVGHYAGKEWPQLHGKLAALSEKVSFRWRPLADEAARPELRPSLQHYDAHNRRIDRIVRSGETKTLEREVFAEALFSEKVTAWEHFAKRLILDEMGEAGVLCPMACTEGLIALIEAFPEDRRPELDRILLHCKEGIDGEFGLGAQFMSEIQGGSDIPANLLEAQPEGDHYRIYGNKFFCSAIHTDYAVVTAKVTGSEEVGTFIVPAWLPGNKQKEIRNGAWINRLKWKLGTVEVPTAEVDFDGAVAYAVGPTNRGVANAVGIVLTLSRIAVGISSAASMIRAAREALLYSEFRDVFGKKICEFPLGLRQVRDLVDAAQRATAGAFKIYDLFLRLGRKLHGGLESKGTEEQRKLHFNLRELIIIQKFVLAYEAIDVLRKAISIFGGHGVMEDFSSLPRLFRDAMVNELWEGPRNVLLMQVYRDLQRASKWYDPREFVTSILQGAEAAEVNPLAAELKRFLDSPPWDSLDDESLDRAVAWEDYCDALFRGYQKQAVRDVGKAPIVSVEKLAFPELWTCEEVPTSRKRPAAVG